MNTPNEDFERETTEMYRLYRNGYSYVQIGELYGLNDKSVFGRFKRRGLPTKRAYRLHDTDTLKKRHIDLIRQATNHAFEVVNIPPEIILKNAPDNIDIDPYFYLFFYAVASQPIQVYRFWNYGRLIDKPLQHPLSIIGNYHRFNLYHQKECWVVHYSDLESLLNPSNLSQEIKAWFIRYWTASKELDNA